MDFEIDKQMQFPIVNINLEAGENAFIRRGSMIYHSTNIKLNAKLNGHGQGLGKYLSAAGRAVSSKSGFWLTQAQAQGGAGQLAVATSLPGEIVALKLGEQQYRINDGKFLAMDGTASYSMKSQSVGRALFSGNGGFFVMTTSGQGVILCNTYGSLKRIDLQQEEITIDNDHVVAWSTSLDYDIHFDNGLWQSVGTGEGIVNTFKGTGTVYIQSLNLATLERLLKK